MFKIKYTIEIFTNDRLPNDLLINEDDIIHIQKEMIFTSTSFVDITLHHLSNKSQWFKTKKDTKKYNLRYC